MTESGELVAAIDLGSNSFHMVIARVQQGVPAVIDRLKEPVRLAAGLGPDKRLSEDAQERAIACLSRFAERLAEFGPGRVRAVGTNTMRKARNRREFVGKASAALGHPIEIVPGREEARLIFVGVAHDTAMTCRRLVVDIGGGSTECAIGDNPKPLAADSLYMGCVSYSLRYFESGVLTKGRFKKARLDAARKLEPIVKSYKRHGWQECLGSSGTINAIAEVARAEGWSDGAITAKVLRQLRRRMVDAGHADALDLKGLREERRQVLAGGVAILSAVVDELAVDVMQPTDGALREGAISDLIGRLRDEDVRDSTVDAMTGRLVIDHDQAARVRTAALALFDQVRVGLGLTEGADRKRLGWAGQLHEVGLAITYSSHHKHGAYLIENSDMPGFSRDEQELIASVVRGHRRKLRHENFERLPAEQRQRALHLCALLRMAAVLNRGRSEQPIPDVRLDYRRGRLFLVLPPGWLDAHPLLDRDLEVEAERLARVGIELAAV